MRLETKMSGFFFVPFLLGVVAAPKAIAVTPVNCSERIPQELGELRKLKREQAAVKAACERSIGDPTNLDNRYQPKPGGECEQMYGLVNAMLRKAEDQMSKACEEFNRGAKCQGSNQRECQGQAGDRYFAAGTHLREAVYYLKKARRIIEKKKLNEAEENIQRYANLGGFDPSLITSGGSTPDLHGEPAIYFLRAREQADSAIYGKDYLDRAKPIEQKLNGHQAKLNSMAAEAWQREGKLGQSPAGSTITGLPNNSAASDSGLAGSGSIPQPNFLVSDAEVDKMPEADFYDGLDSKPVKTKFAALTNPREASTAKAGKSDETGKLAEKDAQKLERGHGSGSEGSNGKSSSAAFSDPGVDAKLSLSRLPGGAGKSEISLDPGNFAAGSFASLNGSISGASSSAGRGLKRDVGSISDLQGIAEANGQGQLKPLGRAGPSLRELLRQKLSNDAGASTKAMHDVLGSIEDEDSPMRSLASAGLGAGEAGVEMNDIKSAESESLFVRIRSAHLRYQKTSQAHEKVAGF